MICFDTTVLIWGVQGRARKGQEGMVERTRQYIDSLRDTNERIMIPTPALTEYLAGFDSVARRHQLAALQRNFVIPAFDVPAAYLAGGLARDAGMIEAPEPTRQQVRTDCQIVATAIVHGASQIITNDLKHFAALANISPKPIDISGVPDVHEQLELEP